MSQVHPGRVGREVEFEVEVLARGGTGIAPSTPRGLPRREPLMSRRGRSSLLGLQGHSLSYCD